MLGCMLQHVYESIAETKTQLFDQMRDGMDKTIVGKQVNCFMVDAKLDFPIEQNQIMAASTNLYSLSHALNSPKPILKNFMQSQMTSLAHLIG